MGIRQELLSLPEKEFNTKAVELLGPGINPIYVKENLLKKTREQLEELLLSLGVADVNLHTEIAANLPRENFIRSANTILESHQMLRTFTLQLLAESQTDILTP